MSGIASSLAAILIVIGCGYALTRAKIIAPDAWQGLERITYHVMVPALFIELLARTDLMSVPFLAVGVSLAGTILGITALLLLLRPLLERRCGIDGPAFTSILQGAIRWNSFVALAMSAGIGGPRGLAMAALALAVIVPLVNTISVSALTRYAQGAARKTAQPPLAFARTLLANPFIWSCLAGLALNASGLKFPAAIGSAIEMIGKGTLPAGLLLVGAGLEFSALRRAGGSFMLSSLLKLAAVPVIAGLIAKSFGLSGADLLIVLVCTSVPTASGSYILARQMGGDAPLMAAIITGQTVLAIITMPLIIALMA